MMMASLTGARGCVLLVFIEPASEWPFLPRDASSNVTVRLVPKYWPAFVMADRILDSHASGVNSRKTAAA